MLVHRWSVGPFSTKSLRPLALPSSEPLESHTSKQYLFDFASHVWELVFKSENLRNRILTPNDGTQEEVNLLTLALWNFDTDFGVKRECTRSKYPPSLGIPIVESRLSNTAISFLLKVSEPSSTFWNSEDNYTLSISQSGLSSAAKETQRKFLP